MMHVLIVGNRGVGKSTLIERVLRELDCSVAGFRTKKEDALTDAENESLIYFYKVGAPAEHTAENLLGRKKSGEVEAFADAFDCAAQHIEAINGGDVIIMDEIGILENVSARYRAAILERLNGDTPVIAAVKNKDTPFLTAVRSHPNCRCFFVTEENRDSLCAEVLGFLREQLKTGELS